MVLVARTSQDTCDRLLIKGYDSGHKATDDTWGKISSLNGKVFSLLCSVVLLDIKDVACASPRARPLVEMATLRSSNRERRPLHLQD